MFLICGYLVLNNKISELSINNVDLQPSYTLSRLLKSNGDLVETVYGKGWRHYSGYIESSLLPDDILNQVKGGGN